jgi:hypothetical protein
MEIEEGEPPNLLAMVATQKFDQAMGGRDIGPNRVRTSAAIMGKMASPPRREQSSRMLGFV